MSEQIQVRQLQHSELPGVLGLRFRVLDEPLGLLRKTELSATDLGEDTIHVAAFNGDRIISCVRSDMTRKYQTGNIRRMATDPDYQNRGIGRQVLLMSEDLARDQKISYVKLDARPDAIGFYARLGYDLTGQHVLHDGLMHKTMRKTL